MVKPEEKTVKPTKSQQNHQANTSKKKQHEKQEKNKKDMDARHEKLKITSAQKEQVKNERMAVREVQTSRLPEVYLLQQDQQAAAKRAIALDCEFFLDRLTVRIGSTYFTIICKSEADQEGYFFSQYPDRDYCDVVERHKFNKCNSRGSVNARDMVCFESSKLPGLYLYAYRSSSELGIWRLAYVRDGDCGLFKGDLDYVQGTSIHHCLMKLIDQTWNSIPDATDFIPPLDDASKPCHASHHSGKGKLCLVAPFITELATSSVFGYSYSKERSEKGMIDDRKRKIGDSTIYKELKGFDCGNKESVTITEIWSKLIQLGHKLQANGFKVKLETRQRSHTYNFDEEYAQIHGTVEVCSVEFANRTESYTLIYSCYSMTYGTPPKTVTGAYGIALLPKEYYVNHYGIYQQYVDANIFICKPFFYKSMCHYNDSTPKNADFLCHTTYLYVGFIFDCWPYNILCNGFSQICNGFSYDGETLKGSIATIKISAVNKQKIGQLKDLFTSSMEDFISNPEEQATTEAVVASKDRSLIRSISFNDKVPHIMQQVGNVFSGITRTLSQGGNKSHKKIKTQRKRTKRKTQKRRSYSIFRSNK